jgi:hypothetical protein
MALVKCPDCGHDVSEAAPSCPGCGRPAPYWSKEQEQSIKDRKSRDLYYLSVGCLGLIGLTALLCLMGPLMGLLGISMPPAATSAPTAKKQEKSDWRRVWRENHRLDDGARKFMVSGMLRKAGERCDEIERMIMGAPGTWTVSCAPGYRYLFVFDEHGEYQSAMRLP